MFAILKLSENLVQQQLKKTRLDEYSRTSIFIEQQEVNERQFSKCPYFLKLSTVSGHCKATLHH